MSTNNDLNKNLNKNLIEIFYTDEIVAAGCGTCASASSCGGGCDDEPVNIDETIAIFNKQYSDNAILKSYKLNDTNKEQVADRLQQLYSKNGESLIITGSNIKFIVSRLTPIIAINEVLTTTNYVPNAFELNFAIEN